MITFRTGISLLILQLTPLFSTAQTDTTIAQPFAEEIAADVEADVPVDPYSFEVADSLVRVKKYERAVWTYINLYPRQPDSVVVLVRRLQPKVLEGDLPAFIQSTFARFAPMDPAISTFDFSGPTLDSAQLKIKADWSESLIRDVARDPLQLDPFGGK
jgi:hypothetical protein